MERSWALNPVSHCPLHRDLPVSAREKLSLQMRYLLLGLLTFADKQSTVEFGTTAVLVMVTMMLRVMTISIAYNRHGTELEVFGNPRKPETEGETWTDGHADKKEPALIPKA